ncbi:MAG TPA: hypothetical protein VJ914_00130 [Pseudonocardiaceae bacterium]|nr:hypothetical protein [Pseudonocardiaceae bacterium]
MAPPSFVEFVQALLVREAVAALCPSLSGSVHLGTKGCLMDFTGNLDDARQKVLRGGVVTHLLDREWLGQPTDPCIPAGIMANLKDDLFTAKGRQQTPREAFRAALAPEGAKQLVAGAGALVMAVLPFLLGVKTGGGRPAAVSRQPNESFGRVPDQLTSAFDCGFSTFSECIGVRICHLLTTIH